MIHPPELRDRRRRKGRPTADGERLRRAARFWVVLQPGFIGLHRQPSALGWHKESRSCRPPRAPHAPAMFVVTEAEAAAIRAAYEQRGEFAAAVELRRRFPGITDNAQATVVCPDHCRLEAHPPPAAASVGCGSLAAGVTPS